MKVGNQVLDLLVGHYLPESFHLGPSVFHDIGDTLVVGGQSAQRQVLILENAFQSWTFLSMTGIGLVAAVAIVIVEFASSRLLRVETEFGVRFSPLNITACERGKHETRRQNKKTEIPAEAVRHLRFLMGRRLASRCKASLKNRIIEKVMTVSVKRVYDPAVRADGTRVLVDRLWPRGLTKKAAAVKLWLRELAPSTELRQWFHANPDGWGMFRRRYLKELGSDEASAAVDRLHELAETKRQVTLLYASRSESRNNATVLKELLDGMPKPPSSVGGGSSGRGRIRKVQRV